DSGRDGLIVDDQQIYIGDSKAGRFDLPARPGAAGSVATSFGPVAFDGSNGVFLVRLSKNLATEYHFATILDFCLAAARGDKAFDLPTRTHRSASATPEAPRYARFRYDLNDPTMQKGSLEWPYAKKPDVLEFRLFARMGRAMDWALFDVLPPTV